MADNNNKLINLGLLAHYDEKIKEYIEDQQPTINKETFMEVITDDDMAIVQSYGNGVNIKNGLQSNGKEVATQDWVNNNEVFEKGSANNSGVLKGQSNQALSKASVSLGKENLSGLKGWYYRGIRKVSNSTINVFLSNTQVLPKWDNVTEDSDNTNLNPMAVLGKGTIVSLVNNSKYDNKFKISNGRAGMVQLQTIDGSDIPFTSIKTETNLSPEDYTIYCLSKPDKGPADIGHYAFVTGRGNKAINVATAVFGTGNTANGKLAIVGGKNNEGGYNTVTFGAENVNNCDNAFVAGTNINNTGNNSFITGNKHTNKGKRAHIEGNNNQNNSTGMNNHIEGENNVIEEGTAANVHLAGIGNKTSTSNQTVVGRYNANNDDALFIVGNGQDTTNTGRKNAFTVQQNGTATVGANPVNDMDVATKGYVDKNALGGGVDKNGNFETKHYDEICFDVNSLTMVNGDTIATEEWVQNKGYVPNTRKINNKQLSTDIDLNGGDIALTGYNGQSQVVSIAETDTVNSAIAKLEYAAEDFNIRISSGAANKSVDTSISDKTSTNLPTSKAVVDFVEGKGYQTAAEVASFVGGKGYQTAADVKAIKVDNADNADNADNLGNIPASDYVRSGTKNQLDGDFELQSQGDMKFSVDQGDSLTLSARTIVVDGDLTIQPSAFHTETNGSSKYLKICTIKTSYTYQDIIFKFSIAGRSQKYQQVTVKLQTGSSPAVLSNYGILVSGHGGNVYNVQGYIFNKGTYDKEQVEIWCSLPSWDNLKFFKDIWSTNSESNTQLTWNVTERAALPTTSDTTIKITAEPEVWQGTASRATRDGNGDIITDTYATKASLDGYATKVGTLEEKVVGTEETADMAYDMALEALPKSGGTTTEAFSLTATGGITLDAGSNNDIVLSGNCVWIGSDEVATQDWANKTFVATEQLAAAPASGFPNPNVSNTAIPTTQAINSWLGNIGPGSVLRKETTPGSGTFEINPGKVLISTTEGAWITGIASVPVNMGGTGATTAAAARTNLGITPANIGAAEKSQLQLLENTLDGLDERISALEADVCLQEDTQILMADNTYKSIQDVKYGDMIMSYDMETNELIPCKSYGALYTGYSPSFEHYCFSNGSILKIYGSHRIFDAKQKILVHSSKMNIGDAVVSSNCEEVLYYYTPKRVPLAVSKRKYLVFCETGLYFANDILCGHPICQPLDLHLRTHGGLKLSEEDKKVIQEYADARDNDYQVELSNPEYVKEALPFWKERRRADGVIKECKKGLAARDYKTIKALQGELSEEEQSENIKTCKGLRKTINDEESNVAAAKEKIKKLQDKYNIHPRKLQVMETENIKTAIKRARAKYKN